MATTKTSKREYLHQEWCLPWHEGVMFLDPRLDYVYQKVNHRNGEDYILVLCNVYLDKTTNTIHRVPIQYDELNHSDETPIMPPDRKD